MTPDELVSRLAPVRVPADFARFGLQDACVALALGLLAGAILSALWRAVTAPRARPLDEARAAIAALAGLPPQERLAGLALLLRDLGGTAPPSMRQALYDPGTAPDPAPLEAAVIAAARRAKP
ncbi:hypothetical protein BYZ73_08220 [Rhodovulum viride]|uniref:Uncharacterized protein n=1 Tax=Rhodovulum viride TaxID=1231134 RepID=A0ABX9DHT0_9RHOB|nr:hypothetical protein [Rhodovulum viride]RAP41926.1 hypothetical protein BYZ73_08220 [Rhodovulum viride]